MTADTGWSLEDAVEVVQTLDSRWGTSYALGRGPVAQDGSRQWMLAPLDTRLGTREQMDLSLAIGVPRALSPEAALLVPLVAEALRAWDAVGTELGAAAVVTEGLPWSPLLAVTAGWYGALPVDIGCVGAQTYGGNTEGSSDDAVGRLRRALDSFPAVCAVELSGRADAIDLLLEAVPKYSRLLFAGPPGERCTIDYYVNIHRKGIHLASTVLSTARVFGRGATDGHLITRACRLLANQARVEVCQAAVAAVSRQVADA